MNQSTVEEILNMFVLPADRAGNARFDITRPFRRGELIAATDGKTLVVTSAAHWDIPARDSTPSLAAMMPDAWSEPIDNRDMSSAIEEAIATMERDRKTRPEQQKSTKCPECDGQGHVDAKYKNAESIWVDYLKTCPVCFGAGQILVKSVDRRALDFSLPVVRVSSGYLDANRLKPLLTISARVNQPIVFTNQDSNRVQFRIGQFHVTIANLSPETHWTEYAELIPQLGTPSGELKLT